MLVAGLLLAAAAAGSPVQAHAPVLVHDRRERSPLTAVGGGPPAAYARVTGPFIQYWLYYADNPQDRGILRTGRHRGDWELVQVRLGRDGRPVSVLGSQHSG